MPLMAPMPPHPETSPKVAMSTPFESTPTMPATAPRGKGMLLLVAFGVLVLAIGIGVGIGMAGNKKKSDPDTKAVAERKKNDRDDKTPPAEPTPSQPKKTDELPPNPKDQSQGNGPRLGDGPPPIEPIDHRDPLPPPTAPAAHPWSTLPAEKQEKVNKAIEDGVAYLRKTQQASGSWMQERQQHAVAMAALPGLTLLECGVDSKDPAVQNALAFVRRHAPVEMMTYDISLCILFLDRNGDPRDRRLIQTLGLRLMAGQQTSGGWTYTCRDVFSPQEELVFFDVLKQTRPKDPLELFDRDKNDSRMAFFVNSKERMEGTTGRIEVPPSAKIDGGSYVGPLFGQFAPQTVGRIESNTPNAATTPLEQLKTPKTKLDDLPAKLRDIPILKPIPASKELPPGDITDNSNTQFGILGMWAAARHHIPCERTLAMLVKRFRTSQNADGSWGYRYRNGGGEAGSGAMNAAGLLGLAVGHGLIAGADPTKGPTTAKDPAIQAGLKSLSTHLDETPVAPRLGRRPVGRRPLRVGLGGDRSCYFLWSVERVGVLYNLPVINDSEWYPWGVDILLPRQQNGAWLGGVGNSDTCLALLFLKRANLTRDLTTRLNFQLSEKKD
jgi:hypothetical protein